jgi:transcriptional regulator with XRE-family HTH domain
MAWELKFVSEWIRWEDAKNQLTVDRKKVNEYRKSMRERVEGVRLADLRKAKKLTQVQLAKRLKIDQSNVSRIERGKFDGVEVKTLKRYIKALGGEIEIRINFSGRSQKLIDSEYEARLERELARPARTPGKPSTPSKPRILRKPSVAKVRRKRSVRAGR